MEVFEAIRTRRSIRVYEDKPVEDEKLLRILEAARLAPSAGNRQPWRFIVVTDPKIKEEIRMVKERMRPPQARGPRRSPLDTAPVVIVGCAIPEVSFPGTDFWKIDVSIALQNLVLAAWELELGTCWIGVFHEEQELKKVLRVPEEARIVAMITVGYPAEKKEPVTDRKPLQQIISYNHW
ncbi:MAG: nitroreductase family protein [Nitrososphaerota archaeon]|nr:nitroreductase family protein [Candidatus Bathyarchaeota archaeon]MDW8061509.1 nitroreductase family protein [Nitrososphaerota archaeon]